MGVLLIVIPFLAILLCALTVDYFESTVFGEVLKILGSVSIVLLILGSIIGGIKIAKGKSPIRLVRLDINHNGYFRGAGEGFLQKIEKTHRQQKEEYWVCEKIQTRFPNELLFNG